MTESDYIDALALLDRATRLLHLDETVSAAEFITELRRLRRAFDAWRVQLGQPPPEGLRN